jgi:hypothetical protein
LAGAKVGGIYIGTPADAHIQAPAILISISGDLPEPPSPKRKRAL